MTIVKKDVLFDRLLKDLSTDYAVVAPQNTHGSVEYCPIKEEPVIATFPPVNSIKEFFFPRSEMILRFNKKEKRLEGTDHAEKKKLLLFGVRSCDASALGLFNALFAQDYEDTGYMEGKREGTIVSIACNNPRSDCFCTSVGGSPFGRSQCDVLAVDLDGRFALEAITETGSKLVKVIGGTEASDGERGKVEELEEQAKSQMPDRFSLEAVRKKIGDSFENRCWDDFSTSCISCSICTFVCPTCHCFDITDVKTKEGADRFRTWDSCMGPSFTLQASGYNPRHARYRRWRQRVFHKFQYLPENLEILGCVGCGRCVTHCPVGIDIRRMLQIISDTNAEVTGVTQGG